MHCTFKSVALMAALAAAGLVVTAPVTDAQRTTVRADRGRQQVQENAFTWSGDLAAGRRVIVRNIIGTITVEQGRGRTLEVTATKRWRRGQPADVSIDATRSGGAGGDVVVCARWNANTECTENSYRTRSNRDRDNDRDYDNNNDTQVDFVIRLPAGAHAVLNTVIGDIEVTGASGTIDANTTNGDISVETSDGAVTASTTNGDIEVRLPRVAAAGAHYQTINGDITVIIPDGSDANVDVGTMHGRIDSDFHVSVTGSISRRSMRGTIGRGGPLLRLSTINGDIRIEKR
jgi:hypothetical protein